MKANMMANNVHVLKLQAVLKVVVLVILFVTPQKCLHAALRTWTGGGPNAYWTTPANWGGSAPSLGDDLVFPAGASRLVNTNDFDTGTVFGSIIFSGSNYVIRGKDIVLTNGIDGKHVSGTNWLHIKIVLGNTQTIDCKSSSGALTLCTDGLYLGRHTAVFTPQGYIECPGVITGMGGVSKRGTGTLAFSGSTTNTYLGATTVEAGTLLLRKSGATAVSGSSLNIGDGIGGTNADVVRLQAHDQIADGVTVTIANSGLLDLNGYNDTVGTLVLNCGVADSGPSGTLRLLGNIIVSNQYAPSVINGLLEATGVSCSITTTDYSALYLNATVAGSSSFYKRGNGYLFLRGTNTYTGLTVIEDGVILVESSRALGAMTAGTVVSNGAALVLRASITNETVTLNGEGPFSFGALDCDAVGNRYWMGPIILDTDSRVMTLGTNTTLHLLGSISGLGGLIKDGPGTVVLGGSTPNTFAGETRVRSGVLALSKLVPNSALTNTLIIGDRTGGPNADVVRLLAGAQIGTETAVVINSSGLLDLNGNGETVGSIEGSGNIDLGPGGGYLNVGGNNRDTVFDGVISGRGDLNKLNGPTGTLVLNGNNTYDGATYVNAGALVINGAQSQSPVQVGIGSTLAGRGVVGHVICGGTLSPGTSPGILTTSNLWLSPSAVFTVELDGAAPGDGYDQLKVFGTINLSNATLNARLGFYSGASNTFTIIDNDGADAVVGVFAGLPEGATVNINGTPFRISYAGGTGNDVVLSQLTPMVVPALGITRATATNLLVYWSTNFSGYSLWASTNLSTGLWEPVPDSPTIIGTNYSITIAPVDLHRFFRLRLD